MPKILCLETATTNCSVALGINNQVVGLVEENFENYSHGEQLHLFIEEVLKQSGQEFNELDAVAVSLGPGSYTGLRIGVSTAKGLCFALDKPMIGVPTLEILANEIEVAPEELILSVLDARRMEVYAQWFDDGYRPLNEVSAVIINESSFEMQRKNHLIHVVGSGAQKCQEVWEANGSKFYPNILPSAATQVLLATQRFENKDFLDIAYSEPFYLKEFYLNKGKML